MPEVVPILKISKWSLDNKVFKRTEAQIRKRFKDEELEEELKRHPTEDEEMWMRVWESDAPGLERIKRKMAICVFVEVQELRDDFFSYTYAGDLFEINAPFNPLKCSEAIETSVHSGVIEMARQSCIQVNSQVIDLKRNTLPVDSIQLLVATINRFFFMTYRG